MRRIGDRALWLGVLSIGLVLGSFTGTAAAQSATLSVGSASALPGEQVSVPVTVSGTDPLAAVSFGLRHEETDVSLVSAELGLDSLQLNGGLGPDFFDISLSGSSATEVGLTFGMLVSLTSPLELLMIATPKELLVVTYLISPLASSPSPLAFSGTLQAGGIGPAIALVTVLDLLGNQVEVTPSTQNGTLTPRVVEFLLPDELSIPIGFETAVPVRYRGPHPLDAFGFGVAHDPAALSLTDVVFSPELDPLFGSPLFFTEIATDGFSVGWIGDLLFLESIPPAPATPVEIIRVTYSTQPGAPASTPLTFSNTVAAMVEPEAFVNEGDFQDPVLFDGSLRPIPAVPFVRGDANGDESLTIIDAIICLQYIFQGGTPSCVHSLDFDDSSQITISDAFGLLSYLFLAAAPPASPFPDCGLDLDAGGLECASTPPTCL